MATKKKPAAKKAPAKKRVAKTAVAKRKAGSKTAANADQAKGPRAGSKTAMLLDLLGGKGSTVEKMCEALGWQAHTLRAALTRLPNGAKAERTREDGVTSYKLA
ncbi:DUF3489 domain-containing protein [Bradyrhizobium barranii subsp. barranii]|uniref:DUF3489 domain-containing protein n=1 Tax=Bradyrhizobium barranii subsp. barranii TaxID=2823807 RepID=A0A939MIM7_9BRAD|nr:DUF3489 domain-containing protein [Bradyrhizobium barranii]UEM11943.1 DUF3489 domain-containing protein [Bradyrhizobium barranii subsp. barranii]